MATRQFESFGKALNAYHKGEISVPWFAIRPVTYTLPNPDLAIKDKTNQAVITAVKAI